MNKNISKFVGNLSDNIAKSISSPPGAIKGAVAKQASSIPAKKPISVAIAHAEKALREKWKYRLGAIGRKVNGVVEVDCYTLITSSLFWDETSGAISKVLAGSEAETILVNTNTQMAFDKAKNKGKITQETKFRPGTILFKPGHVGICVSETHTIEATAARGDDIRKELIRGGLQTWTHWFEDVNFDYTKTGTDVSRPEKISVFSDEQGRRRKV